MGGLPLALDQTGAYLEATQCGLPAYLELFRTRHAALLKQRGESSRDHPASVSTTFTLAITATAQRHPAVWDLLRVCALLQPDAIPEELFRQGGEHLGTTLEAVCHDELEWNGVIAVAGSYSLLSRQPEAQTLSMHRLVQAVLLQQMSEQEQADWLQRTIVALNAVYPETAPNVWDLCERLLPHVLTCGDAVPDHVGNLQVVEMLRKAADYLRVRAQFKLAGSLYQRAVHIGEQVLGPEHPGLAKALNGLAIIYASQGKYKLAEPHFQRALYIWEQVQGSEHRQVVIPLNNLASLYVQQGEYGLAEPLYQRALHINEQALGPEHPELGHPLGGLADIYFEQGRYELAAQLHQRVLSIRERAEGPESLMLAFPLNNLADLYTKQGKVEQAELLYRRAVHICEQTLGLEHPYVTTPLNGLANLFREQDKDMEAESLFQRALRIREQHLGQGHPDTAQTLYDLAIFRQKQGNLSEAVSLTQRVLSIRSQSLGEAHPKTVATRMLHAQLVQEQAAGAAKTALEQDAETMTGVCSEEHQADGASLSPLRRVDVSSSTSDPLHAFLDACCELHPRAWCRSADLWQAYEHWAEEHQERYPLSRGAFLTQVKAHGCRADRTKAMRIWRGITLVKKNDDGR
jgi:tetratricopeptide (TPR) repeat protein